MHTPASFSLGHLSDGALLSSLAAVSRSHQALTAELVAHLAEMDTRKLYLSEATSSLFSYCVERLGFSEDEACRRIEAARMARRFPRIYPKLEGGEVSLSVLGKLKPFLTDTNVVELLEAVSGKSVREAERVLARRFPKPDVADSIRKLPEATKPTRIEQPEPQVSQPVGPVESARPVEKPQARVPDRGRVEPLSEDRFQVKFTASQSLEQKLLLARDLMSHGNPSGDLATVIEAALDLLIADRMKRKFGSTKRARKSKPAKRSRITNATRREVVARDGLRCSFVDPSGRRCSARALLELDHQEAKARGGSSEPENIRILCRAHNQAEAERVFGKDHIERCKKRNSSVRDSAIARYVVGFSKQPATPRQRGLTNGRTESLTFVAEDAALAAEDDFGRDFMLHKKLLPAPKRRKLPRQRGSERWRDFMAHEKLLPAAATSAPRLRGVLHFGQPTNARSDGVRSSGRRSGGRPGILWADHESRVRSGLGRVAPLSHELRLHSPRAARNRAPPQRRLRARARFGGRCHRLTR